MEHAAGDLPAHVDAHLAYLKLINVPTMFDVGCTQANPQTEQLTLCMIDSITHKLVKQTFLAAQGARRAADIEKAREKL